MRRYIEGYGGDKHWGYRRNARIPFQGGHSSHCWLTCAMDAGHGFGNVHFAEVPTVFLTTLIHRHDD